MRISTVTLVAVFLSAAILAACGGSNNGLSSMPVSVAPRSQSSAGVTAERTHVRPTYGVVYSFKGRDSRDGSIPEAGLLNVNGTLYGTTELGGETRNLGRGTVFSITGSGAEAVLHRFAPGSGDCALPEAGVINVKGTLYGTTLRGGVRCGRSRCGTIFAITTSGTESVLHKFHSGSGDGAYPVASLLDVNGTLFGTTTGGGANDNGTVFSITTSGKETVLYSFKGEPDGAYPRAGLTNVKGTLYGTTSAGGTGCSGSSGCGTIFKITTSGKETALHRFGNSPDGAAPTAGLLNVKSVLYGTTTGGGSGCGSRGCGTIFSATTTGTEKVLYRFRGSPDGAFPTAGLLNVNGTLFSTTSEGGADGTVFSITTSGKETVLHSFGGSPDGASPTAGLLNVDGTLYGTTAYGGAHCFGCGTVFSLSP